MAKLTAEDLCYRIDLGKLYPKFREKLLQALQIALDDGKIYIPTFGIRTQAEQDKLYKEKKSTVRFSFHQVGIAVDSAFEKSSKFAGKLKIPSWDREDMEAYGLAGETVGLVWGGRWGNEGKTGFSDVPHLEMSKHSDGKLSTSDLREIYDRGGIKAVWDYLDTLDFD